MPIVSSGGGVVGSGQITDGSIINDDVNANAAIDASKLGPGVMRLLDDVTLGGAGASLTSNTFLSRTFLKVIILVPASAVAERLALRLNSDSGANYQGAVGTNGGDTSSYTSGNQFLIEGQGTAQIKASIVEIINIATLAKRMTFRFQGRDRTDEGGGEWLNTTDPVTTLRLHHYDGGNLPAGTRMMVYGTN